MKVDDLVMYKGETYKIFFDYKNGKFEIMSQGVPRCYLVLESEITKVYI